MSGTVAEKKRDRGGCRKGCCLQRTEVEVKSCQVNRGFVERVFTKDPSGQGASHGNLRVWVERWLGDFLMGVSSNNDVSDEMMFYPRESSTLKCI
jgi:hypothetical protein